MSPVLKCTAGGQEGWVQRRPFPTIWCFPTPSAYLHVSTHTDPPAYAQASARMPQMHTGVHTHAGSSGGDEEPTSARQVHPSC